MVCVRPFGLPRGKAIRPAARGADVPGITERMGPAQRAALFGLPGFGSGAWHDQLIMPVISRASMTPIQTDRMKPRARSTKEGLPQKVHLAAGSP
jgi:hypothetical protein